MPQMMASSLTGSGLFTLKHSKHYHLNFFEKLDFITYNPRHGWFKALKTIFALLFFFQALELNRIFWISPIKRFAAVNTGIFYYTPAGHCQSNQPAFEIKKLGCYLFSFPPRSFSLHLMEN